MSIMTSQFKDLTEFLAKHSAKNDSNRPKISPTHTRIPDKSLHIFGGSFIIPAEELSTFYKFYTEYVFINKKMEYLTERQLGNGQGPILIDLDFRYNYDIEDRQHTKSHIQDLINVIYLELLKEFFVFESNKPFPIFVMEKQHVNRLADKTLTKDGIHIIIGIQMDNVMQLMLRDKVLEKIQEIWDLPLINDWPAVLDEGISKGTTNWQLFGSQKPGNSAYELTQHYTITFDDSDGEFMMDEHKVDDFDVIKNFNYLSVQYKDHPRFEINPKIKAEFEKRMAGGTKIKKHSSKTKLKLLPHNTLDDDDAVDDNLVALEDIKSYEILKRAVDNMLNSLSTTEYHLREIHAYTQVLPEKYYEPGSHEKNRAVGFALKHTDERLFYSWIMLRSKATDFDYGTITELYNKWKKYFKDRPDGVTHRSIMYWAKQDAYEDYMTVYKTTRDYFINMTLSSATEYDFAVALYNMYKDQYVCSSISNNKWYVFHNHRWVPDLGQKLRLAISKDMFQVYADLMKSCADEQANYLSSNQGEEDDKHMLALKERAKHIAGISTLMKKTSEKDKIMKEAAAIFYDGEFVSHMDSNKHLMCFTNGVVDFKNRVFRDGYPQDYITKSTNIAYQPLVYFNDNNNESVGQIITFMEQLFPDKSLNKYMWDHLASSLIGDNINQTFNIYRGSGSNGKSILTDLMSQTLGEYKATVPITLVTSKRNSIGGTSSEVMQLKGVRYAVMQEPSKDDAKINEGVMKELTGGDPLQARQLYCESETFTPQFDLVVCTNTLFDITSNDDGTWRRIRICDFMAKFVDSDAAPVIGDDNPHQFPKDKSLKEKLPKWAQVFASMLVKRAFETQGVVEDCPIVMASSNNYRRGQDHIAAFIGEMVVTKFGGRIKKQELSEEFKIWFQSSQGMRKAPKGVELYEYMDKKFGKHKSNEWYNVEILSPEVDEMDELNNDYMGEHK
jgi:P4 family phage/plasmid primase-like protien